MVIKNPMEMCVCVCVCVGSLTYGGHGKLIIVSKQGKEMKDQARKLFGGWVSREKEQQVQRS
jgi:hypothetical protein